MGLFSFIGSIFGGGAQKKASKNAMQAQVDALNRAIDEQHRQFDVTDQNFAPYRDIGSASLGPMGDLIGVHGNDAQASAIAQLQASPFYQSLYRNGENTLLANASATGGLRGGNTQRSLADFGADTLAQTIQQQLANLGGLSNLGIGATGATANFGQQTANNISSALTQQGQARASDFLTRGGITAGMWNNAGNFLDQAVSAFMPTGGIGGTLGKLF